MDLFNRLKNGFQSNVKQNNEESLEKIKTRLKGLVYDDELVDEYAPLFAKLSKQDGFDKVMELLEVKERQLISLTDTDWTDNKSAKDEVVEQEDTEESDGEGTVTTAEAILANMYKQ